MTSKEVSLEDRQKAVDAMYLRVADAAADWTEARAHGFVPKYIEKEFDDAMAELRKVERRLADTRKRLERKL